MFVYKNRRQSFFLKKPFMEYDMYKSVSSKNIDNCVRHIEPRTYKKGSVIVRQGDVASIYGIVCGGNILVCTTHDSLPPFDRISTYDEMVSKVQTPCFTTRKTWPSFRLSPPTCLPQQMAFRDHVCNYY